MKYHYNDTQSTARYIAIACGLVFVLYAVHFLGEYQVDVLALTHSLMSSSASVYQAGIGTFITTSLLTLLGTLLSVLLFIPLRMKAIVWLPSFVLLGAMASLRVDDSLRGEYSFSIFLTVLLLIVSALAVLSTQIFRESSAEHGTVFNYLPYNICALIVGIFFCNSIANTDTLLHEELKTARYVALGYNQDAMETATCTCHQNNTTTALHAMVLAREGRMGDDLFHVVGLRGAMSLIPDTGVVTNLYHIPFRFSQMIGAVAAPGAKMSAMTFLSKALENKEVLIADTIATEIDSLHHKILVDYYLCGLLLERKLTEFCLTVPRYYTIDKTLPRHYREAVVMHQRRRQTALLMEDGTPVPILEDDVIETNYDDFNRIFSQYRDNPNKQRAACVDMYDGTYWSYFFFQKDL